jgi:hypothetical protein
MRRELAGLGVVCLLLLAACGGRSGPGAADPTPSSSPAGSPTLSQPGEPSLPSGWRWESYGGVEVGVPGDWGWTNGSQRVGQWCVNQGHDLSPAVGRPGAATLVGCFQEDHGVPGELLAKNTGDVVAFSPEVGDLAADRGDRRTVLLGGVDVVVQTRDPGLRDRIAATVHRVDVDWAGCPADDVVAEHPDQRPAASIGLDVVTGVTSVTACQYAVQPPQMYRMPPLLASAELVGQDAQDLVAALASAPPGGGPNAPDTCLPEVSYGDQILVLAIHSAEGVERVVVTYTGCDHNGIDDGTTVRTLTRDAMAPLTQDALALSSFSGQLVGVLTSG